MIVLYSLILPLYHHKVFTFNVEFINDISTNSQFLFDTVDLRILIVEVMPWSVKRTERVEIRSPSLHYKPFSIYYSHLPCFIRAQCAATPQNATSSRLDLVSDLTYPSNNYVPLNVLTTKTPVKAYNILYGVIKSNKTTGFFFELEKLRWRHSHPLREKKPTLLTLVRFVPSKICHRLTYRSLSL